MGKLLLAVAGALAVLLLGLSTPAAPLVALVALVADAQRRPPRYAPALLVLMSDHDLLASLLAREVHP